MNNFKPNEYQNARLGSVRINHDPAFIRGFMIFINGSALIAFASIAECITWLRDKKGIVVNELSINY